MSKRCATAIMANIMAAPKFSMMIPAASGEITVSYTHLTLPTILLV